MYMHVLNIFLQFDGQTFKFDIPVSCKKKPKYQKKNGKQLARLLSRKFACNNIFIFNYI